MKLEEIASKRKEKTWNASLDVAKMLGEVGRHREMRKMLDEIHMGLIVEYGMHHERCLKVRFMIGKALEALGRGDECLNAVNEVLEQLLAKRESYGVEMLGLHLDIAELLKKFGLEEESKDVSNRVEGILKAEQALRSPDSQLVVAELFERLGKTEESCKTLESFYSSTCLDAGQKELVFRMCELGKGLLKAGKHKDALDRYTCLEYLSSSENGEFHWTTLEAKVGMGICLEKLGKDEESRKVLSDVFHILSIFSEVYNEDTWQENRHYAWLLEKMGKSDKAYEMLVYAHEKLQLILGPKDDLTLEAKKDMADMFVRMGRFEEALAIFEKIYFIRKELEDVELAPPKQKGLCIIS